jgi:hypothetical protein
MMSAQSEPVGEHVLQDLASFGRSVQLTIIAIGLYAEVVRCEPGGSACDLRILKIPGEHDHEPRCDASGNKFAIGGRLHEEAVVVRRLAMDTDCGEF